MSFISKPIEKAFNAVANVVSKVVKAVVNIASSLVNFIAQPFMGLLGGIPDGPNSNAEAERQQGVLIQRTGSVQNIPVVYGYRKIGGIVTFAETGSTDNKYLWVAHTFCEGPVEALREVFIDDFQLPADIIGRLNQGLVVNIESGKYSGRVQLQWFPGVYFNNPKQSTVGTDSICSAAPSWRSSFVHNGMAVLFARYEWKKIETQADSDNNPFSGNIPQVQISVLGQRVASLIINNPQTYQYDQAPLRYSTNPAEILLDYLRNPRYGKGLANDDIDWESWRKAAAKCNQEVTYVGGIVGPILTCNFVLDTGQTIFSNVKTLLMGFRAYMPYVQGKYKLKIEDAGDDLDILSGVATIAQTFDKDSIVGEITYTGIEKSNKYNVVSVTYVDPDQKWSNQQVIYPESEEQRQYYIDLDGGRENKSENTFPTLTNYAIAKDMARLLFNKSRRQETCSLTVTSQALELEPGDCIRINSNILDFGTDPWRIVSFKLNDDYSIELSCVRNPDDIYPHVRAGEEDIVLPTYVPKGATIYYPSSQNVIPVGLVPPDRGYIPPGTTPANPIVSPPPSPPPTAGGGGGVGGITNPSSPVAPPEAPIPLPTNDIVVLDALDVTDHGNGTATVNLYFTQPLNATYSGTTFYYRSSPYDPWETKEVSTLEGGGQPIFFKIGPVIKAVYEIYSRVRYETGESSSLIGRYQVDIRNAASGVLSVTQLPSIKANGWSLPGITDTPPARYDARFARLTVTPKLNAGVPFTNRALDISIKQDILTTPVNFAVNGVRIYYKASADTYYNYVDHLFNANYIPGQDINFEFTGDIGASTYPTIPTQIQQNYDFVFRWLYNEGKTAEYQVVATNVRTEYNPVATNPYVFSSIQLGLTLPLLADTKTTATTVTTVEQAPPGAVVDPRDQIASIVEMANGTTQQTPRLRILINAPDASNLVTWRGLNVRYRRVLPGQNPEFTLINSGVSVVNDRVILEITNWEYGREYEIVLTESVRYAGSTVEATNSLVGRGVVQQIGQTVTDFYNNFNFQQKTTEEALRNILTTFPAQPLINVNAWRKRHVKAPSGTNFTDLDFEGTAGNMVINGYYELKWQPPPSGYQALRVYRRVFDRNSVRLTTVRSPLGKYTNDRTGYGMVGAWEVVRVPQAEWGSTDAQGFYTLNLRAPLRGDYLNTDYEGGVNALNSTQLVDPRNVNTTGIRYYPIARTWKSSVSGSGTNAYEFQYFFVLEKNGGSTTGLTSSDVEPRGKLLLGFRSQAQITDGFATGVTEQIIPVSDFTAAFPSGYGRNLADAVTTPDVSRLRKMTNDAGGTFPTTYGSSSWPKTWGGSISFTLANPFGVNIK